MITVKMLINKYRVKKGFEQILIGLGLLKKTPLHSFLLKGFKKDPSGNQYHYYYTVDDTNWKRARTIVKKIASYKDFVCHEINYFKTFTFVWFWKSKKATV